MVRIRKQLLDGNVETLILAILEAGPSYGYQIVKEINERAAGILQLGEGTVYPVLYRLQEKELVSARWAAAENGRQRKYYRLNPKGRKALAVNCDQWQLLAGLMKRVLRGTETRPSKPRLEGVPS
jgi:PadR family transcriptional regulator PadR